MWEERMNLQEKIIRHPAFTGSDLLSEDAAAKLVRKNMGSLLSEESMAWVAKLWVGVDGKTAENRLLKMMEKIPPSLVNKLMLAVFVVSLSILFV